MCTIMVVDDMEIMRDTLALLLKREGYNVVSAANGIEAMHDLERELPDLVLLDVMMPEMDGFQLLEIMHNHPQWRALPVIMLSALSDEKTLQRAEALGAKEFLVKATFSIPDVFNIIRRYTQYVPQ